MNQNNNLFVTIECLDYSHWQGIKFSDIKLALTNGKIISEQKPRLEEANSKIHTILGKDEKQQDLNIILSEEKKANVIQGAYYPKLNSEEENDIFGYELDEIPKSTTENIYKLDKGYVIIEYIPCIKPLEYDIRFTNADTEKKIDKIRRRYRNVENKIIIVDYEYDSKEIIQIDYKSKPIKETEKSKIENFVYCQLCFDNDYFKSTNYIYNKYNNGNYIIIENIPCLECVQCGETIYNFDVAQKTDEIIEKYKDSTDKVTVVDYSNF